MIAGGWILVSSKYDFTTAVETVCFRHVNLFN